MSNTEITIQEYYDQTQAYINNLEVAVACVLLLLILSVVCIWWILFGPHQKDDADV